MRLVRFVQSHWQIVALMSFLVLAAGSGFLAATALGVGSQAPTDTVTLTLTGGPTGATGPTGPPGPRGEPGTPGAESCPTGSTFTALKFIIQGQGPTTIWTCKENP